MYCCHCGFNTVSKCEIIRHLNRKADLLKGTFNRHIHSIISEILNAVLYFEQDHIKDGDGNKHYFGPDHTIYLLTLPEVQELP